MMDLMTCQAPASAKTSLPPSLQGGAWTWEQKDREGSCRPRQAAGVPNSRRHSPSRAPSEPSPSRGCRLTPKEWPCGGGGILLRYQMNLLPDLPSSLRIGSRSKARYLPLLSPAPLLYLFQFLSLLSGLSLDSVPSFYCHWSPSMSPLPNNTANDQFNQV